MTVPAPEKLQAWMTKPGVRAVLVDEAGRVLVLKRPDDEPFWGGYWNLPGGSREPGETFLEGAQVHPLREVAEARWIYPSELPPDVMPPTREIVHGLAGSGDRPMKDLDLTAKRLLVEHWAARMVAPWLKAMVREVAYREKLLEKSLTSEQAADRIRGMFEANESEDRANRQLVHDQLNTDGLGEKAFLQVLTRAVKMGRAEAARAILNDAKHGRVPHGKQGYKQKTMDALAGIARRHLKLVKATTERRLTALALQAEAADVTTMLAKLYDTYRSELIGQSLVAEGYINGVADVLKDYGYNTVWARTMADDRVCPVCRHFEQDPSLAKMTIRQFLKRFPLHPKCRCWPAPSPTAAPAPLHWKAPRARIAKGLTSMDMTLAALRDVVAEDRLGGLDMLAKSLGEGDLGRPVVEDLEDRMEKAFSTVKAHQSRSKSGKVEQVKEYTRKVDERAVADAMAEKMVADKRAKEQSAWEAHIEKTTGKPYKPTTKEEQAAEDRAIAGAEGKMGREGDQSLPPQGAQGRPRAGATAADLLKRASKAAKQEEAQAIAKPKKPRAKPAAPAGGGGGGAAPAAAPTADMPINTKSPDHLLEAGQKLLGQLRALNEAGKAGSKEYNHILTQYNAIRSSVKTFNATKGASATPSDAPIEGNVKMGAAPEWVAGGADKLKTPRQFEIAASQAQTREQAVELAHYYERLAHNMGHSGADWDSAWGEIKSAMKSLPTEAQSKAGVDAKGKPTGTAPKPALADGLAAKQAHDEYNGHLDELNSHQANMQKNGITNEEKTKRTAEWTKKLAEIQEKTGKGHLEVLDDAAKRRNELAGEPDAPRVITTPMRGEAPSNEGEKEEVTPEKPKEEADGQAETAQPTGEPSAPASEPAGGGGGEGAPAGAGGNTEQAGPEREGTSPAEAPATGGEGDRQPQDAPADKAGGQDSPLKPGKAGRSLHAPFKPGTREAKMYRIIKKAMPEAVDNAKLERAIAILSDRHRQGLETDPHGLAAHLNTSSWNEAYQEPGDGKKPATPSEQPSEGTPAPDGGSSQPPAPEGDRPDEPAPAPGGEKPRPAPAGGEKPTKQPGAGKRQPTGGKTTPAKPSKPEKKDHRSKVLDGFIEGAHQVVAEHEQEKHLHD